MTLVSFHNENIFPFFLVSMWIFYDWSFYNNSKNFTLCCLKLETCDLRMVGGGGGPYPLSDKIYQWKVGLLTQQVLNISPQGVLPPSPHTFTSLFIPCLHTCTVVHCKHVLVLPSSHSSYVSLLLVAALFIPSLSYFFHIRQLSPFIALLPISIHYLLFCLHTYNIFISARSLPS